MKILKLAAIALLCASLATSCSKDDEDLTKKADEELTTDENNNGNQNDSTATISKVTTETISAKWVVSGNAEYKSFEFTKSGQYIITKNGPLKSDDEVVLYGTYYINDEGGVVIDAVGVLKITFNGDDTIAIELYELETPDVKIPMTAEKIAAIAVGTKTEMLCQAWRMESMNDTSTLGTIMDMTIVFTNSGTYYGKLNTDWGTYLEEVWRNNYEVIKELYPEGYDMDFETYKQENGFYEQLKEIENESSEINNDKTYKWRWKDDSQTQIEFWDSDENKWDTEYPMTIVELTPTKFVATIIETLEHEQYNPETNEYEWVVEEQGEVTYIFGLESQYVSADAVKPLAWRAGIKMPSPAFIK